jgi:multisubunit Na+/H+ antiporter MnhG subunit
MKKLLGLLLIVSGATFIFISIAGLVKAFDVFSNMDSSGESMGYAFGSIFFPLLLTVIGRWIFRKGVAQLRGPA